MSYFIVQINDENKIWKNYFTFSGSFYLQKEQEINFSDFYKEKLSKNLKIKALDKNGYVVKDYKKLVKEEQPFFDCIDNTLLIREDIFKEEFFKNIEGIEFLTVKVEGNFLFNYKLMSFKKALNCVDFSKSIRSEFDFFSKLVLDSSKIPPTTNCFFLSDWDNYGEFYSIVDEKLKEALLKLDKAIDFLQFDKIR